MDTYGPDAIAFTIKAKQSIVDVLDTLRSTGVEVAVVLDSEGAVSGVIRTSDIEKRIADEVILAVKRRKK